MSVFGEQAFLELKALTNNNTNGLNTLGQTVVSQNLATTTALAQLNLDLSVTNGNVATLSTSTANNTSTITTLGSAITNMNTQLGLANQAISERLLTTTYTTLKDAQNQEIATTYLSKQEFNNYNLTEGLKELAQSVFNSAIDAAVEEVQTAIAVLGTSLIAGTFTLGGQLINNVDDAFLNLDGRITTNTNAIATINTQLTNIATTSVASKADLTYVNDKFATYDTAFTNINTKFSDYYTSQDTDTYLSYKLNGSVFNTYKTATDNAIISINTSLSSKLAITDYNIKLTQLEGDIADAIGTGSAGLTLAGTTSAALAVTNAVVGGHSLAIGVINTIGLPSKVDNFTYDNYTSATNEAILDRYTKTATNGLLDAKANLNGGATFTGSIVLPSSTNYGTTNIQTLLDAKANREGGATFTGNIVLPTTTNYGTTNIQTLLNAKANREGGATFTGDIVLPSTTNYGTTNIQTLLNAKANREGGATFTGNIVLPTTTTYGITNIQTLLDAKANREGGATFTGNIVLPTTTTYGVTNIQTLFDNKANRDGGATFTGNIVLPLTTNYGTTNIQTLLDDKLPTATFTTTIASYSTTQQVDEKLSFKSDKNELNILSDSITANLLLKEDVTANNVKLGFKADTTYVDSGYATLNASKASVTYIDGLLATKASIQYVDDEILNALNTGSYHNSVEIISGSLSDSFIVNTDNVTGEIEAYVNLAMDVTSITALDTKRSPKFISDSSIQADSDWSNGGWLISTNNGDTPYVGFDRLTTTHWSTDGGTFSTSTGNSTSASGYYLQIKYPAAYLLKYYTLFLQSSGTSTANPPRVWTIQGSNNGTTFTIVQSYTKADWGLDMTHTFDVVNEHIPYMYWRIVVTRVQVFQSARERCTIGEWTLYTGWTLGDVKVVSSYTLDFNSFKIVLADASGNPIDMTGTSVPVIPWDFNILITKGGKVVRSGKYRFTNSSGLVIQRITPTGNTISIMDLYGETPVVEEIVPAPVGTIIMYGGLSAPAGYFVCNGAAISRTTYSALFAKIGVVWGKGDITTTFNLPDLRDRFIRGGGGTLGGEVGTLQAESIKSHTHTAAVDNGGSHTHTATVASGGTHSHVGSTSGGGEHSHNLSYSSVFGANVRVNGTPIGNVQGTVSTNPAGEHSHSLNITSAGSHTHSATIASAAAHTHTATIGLTGSTETRPMSACLLYCIKY